MPTHSPSLVVGKRHIKKKPALPDRFEPDDAYEAKLQVSSKSRKPIWRCVALVGVVALGIAAANLSLTTGNAATLPETSGPTRVPPFERYIAAPGRVESVSGRRELAFHTAGRIRTFFVEENQDVKAGELLGELDNADLHARVQMAQAELKSAQAGHAILEADLNAELARAQHEVDRLSAERDLLMPREEEIARARADMRAAQAENKRRQDDAIRNVDVRISTLRERDMSRGQADISAAQLDAAVSRVKEVEAGPRKEALQRASALLDSAKTEVQRTTQTRAARVQAGEARVAQARAQLQWAEAELSKSRLLSPIDGRVIRKYAQPGETVGVMPPVPVIVVADDRKMRVRASIDEGDFLKVKPGQRARISAAAFEGRFIDGTVESVCSEAGEKRFSTGEARERQDVKVIEVIISLSGEPQTKLGLRVTAYLERGDQGTR
jgi:multidrug resistance efflux pump